MIDHIQPAAFNLANAELQLTVAYKEETKVSERIASLDDRTRVIGQQKTKIRADHQAGEMTDIEAAGAFGLADADERDIAALHRTAMLDLSIAESQVATAKNQCNAAAKAIEQAELRHKFDVLSAHVKELDNSLTDAVGELFQIGRGIGLPFQLSAHWKPSQALYRAVYLGVPPARK